MPARKKSAKESRLVGIVLGSTLVVVALCVLAVLAQDPESILSGLYFWLAR